MLLGKQLNKEISDKERIDEVKKKLEKERERNKRLRENQDSEIEKIEG